MKHQHFPSVLSPEAHAEWGLYKIPEHNMLYVTHFSRQALGAEGEANKFSDVRSLEVIKAT